MEEIKVDNEEKVIDEVQDNESKITIEDIKQAIENDLEVKGYIDSLIDSTVNKRLEKRLKKEMEKQQAEQEKKQLAEAEKQEVERMKNEIAILETKLKYNKLLEDNEISSELLPYLAKEDTTLEELELNIKSYKKQLQKEVQREVMKRLTDSPPIPEKSQGGIRSLWNR